jgi:hypothetical protein
MKYHFNEYQAREVLEEKVEEKPVEEAKVEKNDTHDYMQTFSNRRKKVSLLSSIGESITTGIDTLNSEIYTFRETLELTRNVLQDSIEQSKLDLINTKKKAVATYKELGFSVEDISKELDWEIPSKFFCKFLINFILLLQIFPRNIFSLKPLSIGVNC